jgi:hypothetical protein
MDVPDNMTDSGHSFDSSVYDHSINTNSYMDNRSMNSNKKREDKRSSLYTIKRMINGKSKKINIFNTVNHINAAIVNTTTGFPYTDDDMKPYRMGSTDEDGLFKLRFVTHENNIPGITLFFDSPEQCERHMRMTLSDGIKSKYRSKNTSYTPYIRV